MRPEQIPYGDVCLLAVEAGKVILSHYDSPLQIQHKADDSPVTQADFAAQSVIEAHLKSHYPSIPVISEEAPLPDYEERKHWERFWLVDPLDGTKEFIKHNGEFTVNIALIENGKPVFGVIYVPVLETLYYAHQSIGSWKRVIGQEPERLLCEPKPLDAPLRIVLSRSHLSDELEQWIDNHHISERLPTGSSLKFCRVAESSADIYVRFHAICEWDVAAGDCIYRYASKGEPHRSALNYNTPDLKTTPFMMGATALLPALTL